MQFSIYGLVNKQSIPICIIFFGEIICLYILLFFRVYFFFYIFNIVFLFEIIYFYSIFCFVFFFFYNIKMIYLILYIIDRCVDMFETFDWRISCCISCTYTYIYKYVLLYCKKCNILYIGYIYLNFVFGKIKENYFKVFIFKIYYFQMHRLYKLCSVSVYGTYICFYTILYYIFNNIIYNMMENFH